MTTSKPYHEQFVEVELPEDGFLKVMETLTRIGIPSYKNQILYQTCHIFHKAGKYYIVHFKDLFWLDGKCEEVPEEDLGRRNTIIKLLEEWSLVVVVDKEKIEAPLVPLHSIKILPYAEKKNWDLRAKYTIGNKKR